MFCMNLKICPLTDALKNSMIMDNNTLNFLMQD